MSGRRILVTGSRTWRAIGPILAALTREAAQSAPGQGVTVITGGCPVGADNIAASVARALRLTLEQHPADWRRHGRAAGPIRNTEMAALGADVVLTFWDGRSPGTRHCAQQARAAGLRVVDEGAPTGGPS